MLPPTEPSPRKTYRVMAGMAVIVMGLIGLAIYSLSQVQPTAWTSVLKDPVITPTLRQKLPQFEYADEGNGKRLSADNFAGKWTLLSFWAYWCGPCLEEMPALNQLGQQWQGPEFDIVTVNMDKAGTENFELAKKLLSEQSIVLPTLFDKTGSLSKAFAVTQLPHHFLINPSSEIVWEATGAFKWNEAAARDQLMKVMETSNEAESAESADPSGDPADGDAVVDEPNATPSSTPTGTSRPGSAK